MSCDRPEDCRSEIIQPQVGQRLFDDSHSRQQEHRVGVPQLQPRYGDLQITDPYPKARQEDHIQGGSDGRYRHSKR